MKNYEKAIRVTGIILGELFAVFTIIYLCVTNQLGRLSLAIGTIFMVLIPAIVEFLFKCKINTLLYAITLVYTVEPMMGFCYDFYHKIFWWDKLLHITGGVMFALLGILFCRLMCKDAKKRLLIGVFALCFSMAISMCWEFIEYASDSFLGTDMQADTVVSSVTSYKLDSKGGIGVIDNINRVTVNGEKLNIKGYLDIGLIDTMMDMLLETMGALAVVLFYWICREKFPVFKMNRETEQT